MPIICIPYINNFYQNRRGVIHMKRRTRKVSLRRYFDGGIFGGPDGKDVILISPDDKVKDGLKIH